MKNKETEPLLKAQSLYHVQKVEKLKLFYKQLNVTIEIVEFLCYNIK